MTEAQKTAAPADATAAVEVVDEGQAPQVPVDPNFEPEIIVFACHYCAYAAADLAGSMRLQYPTNIRMIKLPCTGKIEAAACQGCGVCVGECPAKAIELHHYTDAQIFAKEEAQFMEVS